MKKQKLNLKYYFKKNLLINLYVVTIIFYLIVGVYNTVYDNLFAPKQQNLSVYDFELYDIEIVNDNTVIAIGNDPQMIYNITKSNIHTVYYKLENSANGITCAYYTKNAQEDFSNAKRLFPSFGQSKEVLYILPQNNIQRIRLDIGSIPGETYVFEELTINKKVSVLNYFKPTNMQLVILVILPLLIYCIISTVFYYKQYKDKL